MAFTFTTAGMVPVPGNGFESESEGVFPGSASKVYTVLYGGLFAKPVEPM